MEKQKMQNLGLPYSVIAKESHTPLVSIHLTGSLIYIIDYIKVEDCDSLITSKSDKLSIKRYITISLNKNMVITFIISQLINQFLFE
jgi:hypothetical protein